MPLERPFLFIMKRIKNWKIPAMFLGLTMLVWASDSKRDTESLPWVVYYSQNAPIRAFTDYKLLIFDNEYHPPILSLRQSGKTVLGYISLGEVENYRSYYSEVKEEQILLEENSYWKGSYFVDLRDSRWSLRVIHEILPRILGKGFDGIFMDTLDNAIHLEETDPEKYHGMKEAAVRLVRTIRYHYPHIKIAMNRAYGILPQVENEIDYELGESVYGSYDFKRKNYHPVPRDIARQQVKLLQASRSRNPQLKILTLDYWSPDDPVGIERIYKKQRANGFEPFVSTIELDRVLHEKHLYSRAGPLPSQRDNKLIAFLEAMFKPQISR